MQLITQNNVSDNKKTGYDFLFEMCNEVRNRGHALLRLREPMTDRVSFIINKLNESGFSYKIIPFSINQISNPGYGVGKLVNIEVFFPATLQTEKNIFYTAHHDIANPNSENCQDNSASVCNLLDLCNQVSEMGFRQKNVYIVFTDCEESGGLGIDRLIFDIKERNLNVDIMLCLELTANGTEYWTSCGINKDIEASKRFSEIIGNYESFVETPYNESINARRKGINAICIGSLNRKDMDDAKKNRYCSTWGLCHSEKDTFENSANKEEMSNFVSFLKRFINE